MILAGCAARHAIVPTRPGRGLGRRSRSDEREPAPDRSDRLRIATDPDDGPKCSAYISWLDGFLTGIAIGPERVPPSEWLPMVCGSEWSAFPGPARKVLGASMDRYNQILLMLVADPGAYDPLFWKGPNGEVIATDWAKGFQAAIQLRPEAWKPMFWDGEAAFSMLVPILALCNGAEAGSLLGVDPEEGAKALADAPYIIPAYVPAIDAFWKDYRRTWRGAGPAKRPRSAGTTRAPAAPAANTSVAAALPRRYRDLCRSLTSVRGSPSPTTGGIPGPSRSSRSAAGRSSPAGSGLTGFGAADGGRA
jgi:uncharacterized protein